MDFLSKILKRKTLFFVFIFLIAFSFAIPQNASASWINIATNVVEGLFDGVLNAFVVFALWYPLLITVIWEGVMRVILGIAITFATQVTTYTTSFAVEIGWSVVRDLANMMIVLGFVVIGIATALRVKTYEATKLLWPLIIVALLVNFSLLICGIFIDGSNLAMNFFFSGTLDNTGAISKWIPGVGSTAMTFTNFFSNDPISFASKLAGIMFFNFLAGFVYFLYSALLLARVVALWILVILSPLAFVCYVFPATKNIWNMWWKNFFQWCIIVIPAGLFYYIGQRMIYANATSINPQLWEIGLTSNWKDFISSTLITVLMPGLFLVVGFFVSLMFSAAGAGAILNVANKYKGTAVKGGLGAISKTSGKVGSSLQNSKFGQMVNSLQTSGKTIGGARGIARQAGAALLGLPISATNAIGGKSALMARTKTGAGRALEAIGGIPVGITGVADIKAVEEDARRIKFQYDRAKLSNDRTTIDKIRNDAKTAQGPIGAASYKVISDAKDLTDTFQTGGVIDFDAIHSRGRFAEISGAQGVVSANEKLNPEYRRYNKYEMAEKTKTMPGKSEKEIGDAVVADGFKKASAPEIQNYHKSVLGSDAFRVNVQAKRVESAARTGMSSEGIEEIKRLIPKLTDEMTHELGLIPGASIADHQTAFNSASEDIKNKVREIYKKINTFKNL